MGDSTGPQASNGHAHGPVTRPLLPLAALLGAYFLVSGGTGTLVGVLLSFAVAPALRPWVWASAGVIVASVAGLLLDRGTTAAVRRFPSLGLGLRPVSEGRVRSRE